MLQQAVNDRFEARPDVNTGQSLGLYSSYGSQFAGTWRDGNDATCSVRESGPQVSVQCDYRNGDRQRRVVETGTVEGPVLRTTAIESNRNRISVSRVLDPNGLTLYERRQAQDGPDERVLDRSYQRVPDPIRCTDVGQLDFKNLTIDLEGELVPLRNGAADTYLSVGANPFEDGAKPQPEFRYEIIFDSKRQRKPSVRVMSLVMK